MAEQTVDIKEVLSSVYELRDSVKQFGIDSSEHKTKAEKIEKFIDKFEEEKACIQAELKAKEKQEQELKTRLDDLELQLCKSSNTKSNYRESIEYKAINNFARNGHRSLRESEVKALRSDNNVSAGYLTTDTTANFFLSQVFEKSSIRGEATIISNDSRTLNMPIITQLPVATFEGEGDATNESLFKVGSESETAYRLGVKIPFTQEMLMDSKFDVEKIIEDTAAQAMATEEGKRHILGTSVKQPEGIIVNSTVVANAFVSSTSGVLVAKDFTAITGELKTGYNNPVYAMNRRTLATMRSFEDTGGSFIWQAGLAANIPNTINGERYIITPDMPDIAANATPVFYGDIAAGYRILDARNLTVVRDDLMNAGNGIVNLYFHMWTTGKVVLPEAFALMKVKP